MPQAKIMVNFTNRKIIHTTENVGSPAYQELLRRGYLNVGNCKTGKEDTQFFWDSRYFDPRDKYKVILPKEDDFNRIDVITANDTALKY